MQDNQRPSWRQRQERRRLVRPLVLTEWILTDLQALQVRGRTDIPLSLTPPLRELLDLVKGTPAVPQRRKEVESPGSLSDLMTALTGIRGALTAALLGPLQTAPAG